MPKVLLLLEYPSLNGGERSLLAMLPAVRAAGWEPVAAAPATGPLADALDVSNVARVPFTAQGADGARLSQTVRREQLAELLRHVAPDLVHANSLSMSRLSGPVTQAMQLPSLGHLRDILKLSRTATADINRHRRLLAVSAATRDYHVAAGLDAERVHVLYNGVDLARFAPRPKTGVWRQRLGLPSETPLIGSIGQIGMRKGLDVALQAVRQVIADSVDLDHAPHWVIVGSRHSDKQEAREYEADLRAASQTAPLAGRVHFLGELPDVAELLNELTILLHAARQEPLGRVLLEGAAAGVAVLATDVGGTAEIFPPIDQAATLTPPDDPQALAAALAELLANAELRQRQTAHARRIAKQRFDAAQAGLGLVQHYQAVSSH